MAGEAGLSKFLNPRLRPQAEDIKAAAGWGVAASTTALWLIQPFDWIKKTFFGQARAREVNSDFSNFPV